MANEYLNRKDQMFPKLTTAQMARIAHVGVRREVSAGEVLFAPGEQNSAFFVIVRGEVEISRPHGDKEEVIVTHGPGEFTGEINMLSSRANLALAYYEARRMTDAIALFRHTLSDCEQALPPDHPLTRSVRESLQAATRG